jgi:hypothetical protein
MPPPSQCVGASVRHHHLHATSSCWPARHQPASARHTVSQLAFKRFITLATTHSVIMQLRSCCSGSHVAYSCRGYQLMARMGYTPGSGLGASRAGPAEPLAVELRAARSGLGVHEQRKRAREEAEEQREQQGALCCCCLAVVAGCCCCCMMLQVLMMRHDACWCCRCL